MSRSWRIIGVGTAHGDDFLGIEVIHRLQNTVADEAGWEFHAVDSAARLLDLLDADASVILVDALAPSARPGTIHRMTWPDPRLESLRPGSTHALGVANALNLAVAIGNLPNDIVIFGVETGQLDAYAGLSLEVDLSLSNLLGEIRSEMRAMRVNRSLERGRSGVES